MNPNAEKWLSELESGKWKQGKEALCEEGSYCCLGVLTELYVREHPEDERAVRSLYSDGLPLPRVLDWAGINKEKQYNVDSRGYDIQVPSEVTFITSMNDGGVSFSEIASFLRKHQEEIFDDSINEPS